MPSPRRHLITWHKSNSLTTMAFLFQIHLHLTSRLTIPNISLYHAGPCHSSKSALSFTLVFKAFNHMNSADFSSFCPTFINKPWAPCKVKHFSILPYTHWSVLLLSLPPRWSFLIKLHLKSAIPLRSCPPQPSAICIPKTPVELQLNSLQYTGIIPCTEPSAFIFSSYCDPREFGIIIKDYLVPHNTLAHLF